MACIAMMTEARVLATVPERVIARVDKVLTDIAKKPSVQMHWILSEEKAGRKRLCAKWEAAPQN